MNQRTQPSRRASRERNRPRNQGYSSQLTVWFGGQQIVTVQKRSRSGEIVPHPDQFRTVPSTASARRPPVPQGHLVPAPQVAQRALQDYDQLCGVSGTLGRPPQEVPA